MTTPILDLGRFHRFWQQVTVPTRDYGPIIPWPMFGTQQWMEREIMRGLEDDVHEFVILKGGRQVGGSTWWDILTLYYLQEHGGLVGSMISDDDSNRDYRRLIMLDMLDSLPVEYRWRVTINNQGHLAWQRVTRAGQKLGGSRLIFGAAGKRKDSNLGRSKGVNYAYNDELGSWLDDRAYFAVHASYSQQHPLRLYGSISTARGIGSVFHQLWRSAQTATTQRAIFVAWWMHRGNRIERGHRALWARYGEPEATADERLWLHVVTRRYGLRIEPEQLAWWRWKLAEECLGDAAYMAQEYASLPEEAFQAFGDKFIAPATVRVLRAGLELVHPADGYEYVWGSTLDTTRVVSTAVGGASDDAANIADDPEPDHAAYAAFLTSLDLTPRLDEYTVAHEDGTGHVDPLAPLLIWEEPDPAGVYIVAAHPWGSSAADATMFCAQVWRAWPDRLAQVAEYASSSGLMYQFAWACLHLAGAYRGALAGAFFILEQQATGLHVYDEIRRILTTPYGLSSSRPELLDVFGSIQQYVFVRPNSFRPNPLPQWQTSPTFRPMLLYAMQDEVERGRVAVRSQTLIDELASLRRGERGDNDEVQGGGTSGYVRTMTLAMAIHYWQQEVMAWLPMLTPPAKPEEPKTPAEYLVAEFLQQATGR